LIHLNQLNIIP